MNFNRHMLSSALRRLVMALWLGFFFTVAAHAGRSCEDKPMSAVALERGMALAARTATALDASGAQVVLLARAGQDLSRYGLRYSHLAWAYRSANPQGQMVWRVVHKLNHCGTAEAAVYRQGFGEFFLDDPWRFEAAWVVPSPELQARLLPVLQDTARATLLHHKPYNLVSYVWGQRYQQSNQWAIETLAVAAEGVRTRQQAQAWLQVKGYEPTTLRLGAFTRLGGRIGSANIAFDDHPNEKRFSDRIETVTADSVFDWLARSALSGPVQSLAL